MQFRGLSAKDVGSNPPDPALAVGPHNLVTTVNWGVGLFSKTGQRLAFSKARDFYGGVQGDCFDQHVLYHPYLKRFMVGGIGPGYLFHAKFSHDDNPQSLTSADWGDEITWTHDGPSLFMGGDASDPWYVFLNQRNGHPAGTAGAVYPIGADYPLPCCVDGGFAIGFAKPWGKLLRIWPGRHDVVDMPAELAIGYPGSRGSTAEPGAPMWIIRVKSYPDANILRLFRVNNPMGNFSVDTFDVNCQGMGKQPQVMDPGGSFLGGQAHSVYAPVVRHVDDNVMMAVALGMGNHASGFGSIFWKLLDVTESPFLMSEGEIGFPDQHAYNPSVAIDGNGRMAVNFTRSSSAKPISHCVQEGELSKVVCVSPSKSRGFNGRFGDYSVVVVDPVDESFWSIQQIADDATAAGNNQNWATSIEHEEVAPPPPPPVVEEDVMILIGNKTFAGKGKWLNP